MDWRIPTASNVRIRVPDLLVVGVKGVVDADASSKENATKFREVRHRKWSPISDRTPRVLYKTIGHNAVQIPRFVRQWISHSYKKGRCADCWDPSVFLVRCHRATYD